MTDAEFLADRTSGPWYGPQMTYYRQKQPLVWDAAEIVAAVKARIEEDVMRNSINRVDI